MFLLRFVNGARLMEYYQEQRLSECQKDAPTVHGDRATCVDKRGASAGAG